MADIQSNIKVNIDTTSALASIKLLQGQISAFQQQMGKSGAAAAQTANNMQQNLINSLNSSGKFNASLQSIKTTTESFTTALEKNKLSLGEYFRYSVAASKSFGKTFQTEFETINKVARERVKDLQTQYIKMGRDANGAMKAIAIRPLTLDMEDLGTKTQIAAQRQQLLNQLLKQGSTNLLNFGKNTQWAGRQLMVGFTVPMTMAGTAAARAYMQLEQASIAFKRVYGDARTTAAETNKMVKEVQNLAASYTKYGVAVADTMDMAAKAAAMGKQGAALLAQIDQATKLSVLGGVDQKTALDTTISLTNAFGIATDKLSGKINFLNSVENQTVLSIEDLTTAIPKAAPVVKQLGGNVEDLAYFLTAMKEGGVNASEGANALKSGLASLINPTKTASDFLQGFGINVKNIVQNDKGDLKKTVLDFATALNTLDPLNRAKAIEMMFGKFQFARMSTLLKNVTDQSSQAAKVMELAQKSPMQLALMANKELEKVQNSPMFKFQKALADIQLKIAPIGESILKVVTPILGFVTKALDGFNHLSDGFKNFIIIGSALGGVIAPALLMVVGLVANGAANILKFFALIKNFFNKTTTASQTLGETTNYLTSEQIKAEAVAASLDQVHGKLQQTFTAEAESVNILTAALQRAVIAQEAFSGPTFGFRGNGTKKYASGGMIHGPGSGTSDSIPAMVSNGEFIVNAKRTKQYLPLLNQIANGSIPGFASPSGGSIVGGVLPPSIAGNKFNAFGNAVMYLPYAMNTNMGGAKGHNTQDVASYIKTNGGNLFAPYLVEIARHMLGPENASPEKIKKIIENNSVMFKKFANGLAQSVASGVAQFSGETIKDADFHQIATDEARKLASKGEFAGMQKAANAVLDEATTFEDKTVVRVGSKGGIKPIGRRGLSADIPAYDAASNQKLFAETRKNLFDIEATEKEALSHFAAAKKVTSDFFSGIKNKTDNLVNALKREAIGVVAVARKGGLSRVENVPINSSREDVVAIARSKATVDSIIGAAKKEAQINSPSKRAKKEVGNPIADGIADGITEATPRIEQAMEQSVSSTLSRGRRRATAEAQTIGETIVTSGGSRRATRPGDLEARQAADAAAAAEAERWNAPGVSDVPYGPAKPTIGQKVNSKFMTIKNKITPGTATGIGMAATMGLGMLSSAPGPIGNIAGQIMPIVGIITTLGPVLSTLGTLFPALAAGLSSALPPLGLAVAAIGGLILVTNMIADAQKKASEKHRKDIEGLGIAASTSAKELKGLSGAFGFTAKKSGLQLSAQGISSQSVKGGSEAQQRVSALLSGEIKDEKGNSILDQYSKNGTLDALRKVKGAGNVRQILQSKAIDLIGSGMDPRDAQALIDALKIKAGKGKVNVNVEDMLSKTNRETTTSDLASGNAKAAAALGAAASEKGAVTKVSRYVGGRGGGTMFTEAVFSDKYKKSLGAFAGQTSSQIQGISKMFENGEIKAKRFNKIFSGISDSIKALPKPVQLSAINGIMTDLVKQDPGLKKLTGKIKTLKDPTYQLQALQAAAAGVDATKLSAIIATLTSSKDPKALKEAAAALAAISQATDPKKTGNPKPPGGGGGGGTTTTTDLIQQVVDQINQFKSANALINTAKNYTSAFADFLSQADTATRKLYMTIKNGKAVLTTKGIKLEQLFDKKVVTEFVSKQKQAIAGFIEDARVRATLGKRIKDQTILTKMMADADFKAAIASALNIKDAKARKKALDELIKTEEKYLKDKAKADYASLTPAEKAEKANAVRNAYITQYQDAISSLKPQEDAINKAYDDRIAALDEIATLNQQIADSQKAQLDLADALSRGDIAAAAKTAADIRAKAVADSIEQQKTALAKARDAQLNALTVMVNGERLTIQELTARIAAMEAKNAEVSAQVIDPSNTIDAINANDGKNSSGYKDPQINNSVDPNNPDLTGGLYDGSGTTGGSGGTGDGTGTTGVTFESLIAAGAGSGEARIMSNVAQGIIQQIDPATAAVNKLSANSKLSSSYWQNIVSMAQSGKSGSTTTMNSNIAKAKAVLGLSSGGLVPKYFASGGFAMGSDTIPAMLTPGEFVMTKSAVDRIGTGHLNAINNGADLSSPVYNSYSISVTAATNANPNEIARVVLNQIQQIGNQQLRGSRI